MRINNHNPLDPFAAADAVKARASKAGDAKASYAASGPADAGQTQALIAQAMQAPDFRDQIVAEVRQLVEAGQLESNSAIERLAERLMDMGI